MGPRSWTNQRRKSSLWQNWRPQLLSVTLTSLKRYLQLENIRRNSCESDIRAKVCLTEVSLSGCFLTFILYWRAFQLVAFKDRVNFDKCINQCFLSPSFASLFSFLNFFLKSYKLDLVVKYWRYLLFAEEKYLEMIKKNVEYRLPATPKALTL